MAGTLFFRNSQTQEYIMNTKISYALFAISILTVALLNFSFVGAKQAEKPLNIIIMIGDGMGLSQMTSAFFYGDAEPNFSRFPIVGLSRTSSSSDKITDSAAGATAISTGKKTHNGAIGLDSKKRSVETLLEYFAKQGKKTGLISTSSITHATPASFYAHEKSRKSEKQIAEQLVDAPIHFFAGGGQKFFNIGEGSKDLVAQMVAKGFYINTKELDKELPDETSGKYGYLLAKNGMPKVTEGRGDFLTNASKLGIDALKQNESGFFMMIEGSQIDWGGHANNATYVITETIDFDKAIGAVLDFAEKDGNTLVIVTADHETGGFTLRAKDKKVPFFGLRADYNELAPSFSTGGHSAAMVPVLAYGPGQELFSGIYQNTDIHKKILELVKQ